MNELLFYRDIRIKQENIDSENKKIDLSISSEEPVRRWFGTEVLLHTKDSVDLSRLNSALLNHNPDKIIGRVENSRLEKKKVRASIVFDDDELSNSVFKKVESGSLKGVSIGYSIEKFRELQEDEEWGGFRGPLFIATAFSIYEASLTPIPADSSVGVGRDLTRSLEGIEIENSQQPNSMEDKDMTKEEIQGLIQEARKEDQAKITALEGTVKALQDQDKVQIRISGDELNGLMGIAAAMSPDAELAVARMVGEGKTKEEIQTGLLKLKAESDAGITQKGDRTEPGGDKGKLAFAQIDDNTFFRSFMNPATFVN